MARSSKLSVDPVQMSVPSIPVRLRLRRCGGKASSRRASNTDTRAKTSFDATSDELWSSKDPRNAFRAFSSMRLCSMASLEADEAKSL